MKIVDLQPVVKPDVTLIPNSVLDQFLPEANELQLKVYLYILRNMHGSTPIQISVMADYFNETEKDITRAISFWEKRGIFCCGQPSEETSVLQKSSSILTKKPSHDIDAPSAVTPSDSCNAQNTEKASADPCSFHQNLSRDTFGQLSGNPDFEELIFLAESYMGKPLNSNDLHILLFVKENLGLSGELIDFLLQHCAECGKKSFHYVQKVACEWAKQGITTPEEAQVHCSSYNKRIYAVMSALGKKSHPTNAELDYIERWYQQYGFELDVILEACRRTVLATDRNRFSYADKILSSWHAADVHHIADISQADASYQAQKKQTASRKQPAYAANNPFLQHQSSNVDYAALEKELLSN